MFRNYPYIEDDYVEYEYHRFERPQFPELRLNPQAQEFIPDDFHQRIYRDYPIRDNGYREWDNAALDRSYLEYLEVENQSPLSFSHRKQRHFSKSQFKNNKARYSQYSNPSVNKYLSPIHGYGMSNLKNHKNKKQNGRGTMKGNLHMHRRASNGSASSSGSSTKNEQSMERFTVDSVKRSAPRKYSYRSKQNKIDVVLATLRRKYSVENKLAEPDEVLRGQDTLRVDVKRYTALQQIEEVIESIESDDKVEILRVDFPVSQKNRFQKKGFIAYLKLKTVVQADYLHRKLNRLMDPKYPDKTLFRVNIAIDQRNNNQVSSSSTSDSGKETDMSSQASCSQERTTDNVVTNLKKKVESLSL